MSYKENKYQFELILDGISFGKVSYISHSKIHAFTALKNELSKKYPSVIFERDLTNMKIFARRSLTSSLS